MTLINSFFLPLVLTIIIEGLVALAKGYRSRKQQLVIFLINLLTNSLLNFIVLFCYFSASLDSLGFLQILCLEVLIIIAEWRLLFYVFRDNSKKLLSLSITMNAISFILGVIFLGFWF